jgi:DNA-binding PadR family transcriptional regulator
VNVQGGALYPLLQKLCDEGLVDMLGEQAAGKSGRARMYYGLAAEGRLRLIEELKRQQHAVRIGEAAGLFDDDTPPDIQRLLDLAKY